MLVTVVWNNNEKDIRANWSFYFELLNNCLFHNAHTFFYNINFSNCTVQTIGDWQWHFPLKITSLADNFRYSSRYS